MATFAHLVGFNQDYKTVMHIHPKGAPVLDPAARVDRNWSFRFMRCSPASFVFLLKCRSKGVHDRSLRPPDRRMNSGSLWTLGLSINAPLAGHSLNAFASD